MLNQTSKHDRSNEAEKRSTQMGIKKIEMHRTDNNKSQITDLPKQHEQGTRNVQIEQIHADII